MKISTHAEIQDLLLSDPIRLDTSQQSELDAHLAICEECRAFASQLRRFEPVLRSSLHARWDSAFPSRGFSQKVIHEYTRKHMYRKLSSTSSALVKLSLLGVMVLLLVWAIPILVFKQTPILKLPLALSTNLQQAPFAADLNLQPQDLGSAWMLAVEETEFSLGMDWDVDQQGLPIIYERTTPREQLFTADDLESFSLRGYADQDREAVIISAVVIFKSETTLQAFAEQVFPEFLVDRDLRDEDLEKLVVDIGDKGTQLHLFTEIEGELRPHASAGFHTQRVLCIIYVQNHRRVGNIPLSTDQIVELARVVEARIGADY